MHQTTDQPGGICYLRCPECGDPVKMGLPRSVRVDAVTPVPETTMDKTFESDDPRDKRRPNRCGRGHSFHVRFQF